MNARAALAIAVATTLGVVATPAARQNQAEAVSTLRIELLPYTDSAESLRQIAAVLRVLPPRRVALAPQATLSALIVEQYGFGRRNLPETYSLLEARILELNGWARPEQAQAGPVLIPSLPSNVRFNQAIAWNELPATADFRVRASRAGIDMTTARVTDVVTERVADSSRLGANGITMELPLTPALLREVAQPLAGESFVSIPSEPIRIRFESQDECKPAISPPLLTASQRAELGMTLSNVRRSVPLYIIDTGWPSAEAQTQSWEAVRSLITKVRAFYRLPVTAFPQPPATFTPAKIDHCKRIDQALAELRAVAPSAVVPIYIPLSREQGAGPLLKEIIELADIVRRVTSRFSRNAVPSPLPPDILNDARGLAETIVSTRIPERISGGITETDKAVVEGLIWLAGEHARLTGTFHVVNESWVVTTDMIRYEQPSNPMGLIVAAAGNDERNINVAEVDFAHRSSAGGHFVAVMNMDLAGKTVCRSAVVDLSVIATANVIGYPGTIPFDSGTSYAAPRIGWLLAAAESVRPTAIEPGLWISNLQQRLRQTRGPATNPPSLRPLLGDPVKLVRVWLQ